MAIIHANGFGTVPVSGDYFGLVNGGTGASTWSREVGRTAGGYALRHTNSTSGNGAATAGRLNLPSGLLTTEFSLGFALNHRAAWTPLGVGLFGVDLENNGWVNLGTGSPNTYGVGPGITAWAILDSTVTGIGWHWWNFIFRRSATVGFFQVHRDGVLLAQVTPDTVPTVAATYIRVLLGNANGGAQVDIADLVFRDDATVIPDSVVSSLFPDATTAGAWVGSDGDSVNNHLLVNESPTYSAATYVGSATVGAVDTYTLGNLPSTAASVAAVQVGARAFKGDAGSRTITPMINGVAGAAVDPGGGSTVYNLTTTNPSGGAAWDTASVNAMTAGIKVMS